MPPKGLKAPIFAGPARLKLISVFFLTQVADESSGNDSHVLVAEIMMTTMANALLCDCEVSSRNQYKTSNDRGLGFRGKHHNIPYPKP